ncbi:MAG TPA: glycolate oxidase subunit GlcE [Casimicrobiaceae bacterium]|nr:glycolate oxidase subunit GlcE [Casimicrobiaceae bacterium]
MADAALAAIRETVRAAAAAGTSLEIRGAGTKRFYGGAPAGTPLDIAALSGIVLYSPKELVVTALAGTPLADLEQAMHREGQMLAFEPPHFDGGGTLGGAIATGLSGPRRPWSGAARDFVLGLGVIDGTGEALTFGGRVMKNVAGFDVARLMTGALGTLGVITEVSLKCLPLPKAETTLVFECDAGESIRRVSEWGTRPLPITATCHHDGRLWVRLSGAQPAVAAAVRAMGGREEVDHATLWPAVRHHTHPFFAKACEAGNALWRLSVRGTAAPADLAGEQMIEWGGALRWLAAPNTGDAAPIREWARSNGGHATLFRARDKSSLAFAPLDATLLALHKRLKATFDPHGVFNRGRLYPDF